MNIKGIGIDIEEVARFRKFPYAKNRSFYEKIFSKKEIVYCLKAANPAESFAARFAAKEAYLKASGRVVALRDIEIRMKGNMPSCIISGKKVFLSLSHTKTHAIAFVVIAEK